MGIRVAAIAALLFISVSGAVAGPRKGAPAKPAKLTEVRVCPIMGSRVTGEGGGSVVYGKYRVHFCCSGCKPAFETLTKAEKDKKIAIALRKQKG